ncbi:hypothetical protein RJ639_030891 [Escallonia herrerae]|uniref:Cystatin domain-containing protein n=1 Tax=Escallonia herrerae TaxID=1293975 RepID=A0AA88WZJ5_9ASTE|nr:hypothetical protein RJ639_030891 [Escallonia herrerae]
MALNSSSSLPSILSIFVLLLLVGGSAALGGRAGGWQPIKDVKVPEVQEIAKYAVAEHNSRAKTDLRYESVVRGETQVVAGTNYRLVIAARDGGVGKQYEAVVWVKPWQHFRNLTSFNLV